MSDARIMRIEVGTSATLGWFATIDMPDGTRVLDMHSARPQPCYEAVAAILKPLLERAK